MRFPQGHCQRCGKVDDRTAAGLTHCAVCAENCNKRAMKNYNRRVSEKRCVTCGIQDERTLRGRRQCELCARFAGEKKRLKEEAAELENAGNDGSQTAHAALADCPVVTTTKEAAGNYDPQAAKE